MSLDKREIIERRTEPCAPDDGLYGQLSLLTHLLKHPLRFKTSEQGTMTLEMVSETSSVEHSEVNGIFAESMIKVVTALFKRVCACVCDVFISSE